MAKKECPPHLGKENTDAGYLRVRLSVLGYLVNHLCGKMQSFLRDRPSCLLMLERKRVGHILARPLIFPRIWKDKGIAKNLRLELFPLIVALAI